MSILEEALKASQKPTEKVGPAIATLDPEDQQEIIEAMLHPEVTDPVVADLLSRHTKAEITASQIAHYARTRLGRKR